MASYRWLKGLTLLRRSGRKEGLAMARVDEVGDGIYRISTTVALGEEAFQFNQFLIDDEQPTLIHTGMCPMYEGVRKAVAEVIDPASLAYVVSPHFESDECGGMGRFSSRPNPDNNKGAATFVAAPLP